MACLREGAASDRCPDSGPVLSPVIPLSTPGVDFLVSRPPASPPPVQDSSHLLLHHKLFRFNKPVQLMCCGIARYNVVITVVVYLLSGIQILLSLWLFCHLSYYLSILEEVIGHGWPHAGVNSGSSCRARGQWRSCGFCGCCGEASTHALSSSPPPAPMIHHQMPANTPPHTRLAPSRPVLTKTQTK